MPVNSAGGLKTRRILARFVFQLLTQAEAAEGVCVPRTVGWHQKRPEFPLEGHNRAGNVGHCYDPETKQQFCLWKSPSAESEASPAEHQKPVDVLTVRLLFIRNLFFWARRLTSIIAGRLRIVWGRKSTEDVRNDGRTGADSFKMTTGWCKPLCHSYNLWSLKTWLWPHQPPCSPDLAPCGFFSLPKMKLRLHWRRFHLSLKSGSNR
jgi:hypothetical protein